jgi:outer membrane lipoprotein-sorting protein
MTAARRWWSVGFVVLLLLASPAIVRALPVSDSDVSATALLHRIRASRDVDFSGYAETTGNVALPANDALSGLTQLLADSNRVRVWWRDPATWRVSTLRPTGETDLVHSGTRTVRWVYESKRATAIPDVPVRLPTSFDVLPNELARHVLAGARPSELTRLPARRVAGRDALGLRLVPSGPEGSVGRVDVYADRASGIPLSVDVYARGSRTTSLTSHFADFTPGRPPASALRFTPPDDARVRFDEVVDLAAAADRFSNRRPPKTLVGLPARTVAGGDFEGSVGVYGRGPTVLLAVPLWSRTANRLRRDLGTRPGVGQIPQGTLLEAPPLRLLLGAPEPNRTSWLLLGTVTEATLVKAADELARHRPELRGIS